LTKGRRCDIIDKLPKKKAAREEIRRDPVHRKFTKKGIDKVKRL
jgi:hypothetical protein